MVCPQNLQNFSLHVSPFVVPSFRHGHTSVVPALDTALPEVSRMSKTSSVDRRDFLRSALTAAGAAAGVAAGASLPAVQSLNLLAATGRKSAPKGKGGYGPLLPAADLRDGVQR